MVKSIDVALTLINESIKRGQNNPDYYMDYIKLHKLMYLGQCLVRNKYEFDLFGEQVLASETGPYIEGLDIITAACGFEEIKDVEELKKYTPVDFLIPILRKECCDLILDIFGKYNTEQIVKFTKNTFAYRTSYIKNQNNIIHKELMTITGEELFGKDECKVRKLTPNKTNKR